MAVAGEAVVAGASRRGVPPSVDDVARRYEVDGIEILVGRSARDNDTLSIRIARPRDVWLHAAGVAGSHVIVRRPESGEIPKSAVDRAAELAAWHSKARTARGKVPVHSCEARDVSKARGAPAGQVRLKRYEVIRVYPKGDD